MCALQQTIDPSGLHAALSLLVILLLLLQLYAQLHAWHQQVLI